MIVQHDISAVDRRRRDRKVWRAGLLLSVLFHSLIFLVWPGNVIPLSPFAAAGPRAGDNRAAAGGLQAINVRTPLVRPIIPPPAPIMVEVEIDPVEFEQEEQFDPASVLGEQPGLLEKPGLGDGTGQGDGGNADEGFFRLQPAIPRGMIIPPTNRGLRGTEVQVWVFVNASGRVVADSTRLDPPTRDRSFNRHLISEAAEWIFRPAVQEGKPVASWFPYRITMQRRFEPPS
jgi:hypothetical protein